MNQSLETRVASLEKNLRQYRLFIAGLLAIVAFGALMSFKSKKISAPDLIQAKAFQVVNDDGQVLVEINQEDGNGQLTTYTPQGKSLVSLFTTDAGSGGLNTFGANGKVIFKVTNTEEGGGYMALFNSTGNEVIESGVTEKQTGYFKVNDELGEKQAWITYTKDGGGYLSLSKGGKETIRLSTPEAGGRIGVYNNAGTRVGYIGAQENKDGNLTIWNSNGTQSGGLPGRDNKTASNE